MFRNTVMSQIQPVMTTILLLQNVFVRSLSRYNFILFEGMPLGIKYGKYKRLIFMYFFAWIMYVTVGELKYKLRFLLFLYNFEF